MSEDIRDKIIGVLGKELPETVRIMNAEAIAEEAEQPNFVVPTLLQDYNAALSELAGNGTLQTAEHLEYKVYGLSVGAQRGFLAGRVDGVVETVKLDLHRVVAKAKEMYEAQSERNRWDDLDEWQKLSWFTEAAGEERMAL